MTTTERRIEALEGAMEPPNNEICILVIDDDKPLPTCPKRGIELTEGLDRRPHECNSCTVKEKNQRCIIIRSV
ncbi:MAG TPA: hypothetical protein VGK23_08690 [Methanomassiliicoccales archaeon]|jgi:hypothetical protein